MNGPKSLLTLWAIVTTSMIFVYIWHQNNLVQVSYKRQSLEQQITKIKKNILDYKNTIAQKTTPEKILSHAKEIGLIKTPASKIHAIFKKKEMPHETTNRG